MLFNTAWLKKPVEVKPKSDLLSAASLQAWLERQPAGEAYNYKDPHTCLLAKYFAGQGESGVFIGTHHIHGLKGKWMTPLPDRFYAAVTPTPHTYGAALKRLKAVA